MEKASKANNWHYNPNLQSKAQIARGKGAKAEAYLWKNALKNKILGYTFLRHRPVLNFIVDFMCPELLLIIEVDGITHEIDHIKTDNINRQKTLESVGFSFIRIEDRMIINNPSQSLSFVEQEINKIANQNSQ